MQIDNKEKAKKIRKIFYSGSVLLMSLIAVFFLLDYFKLGLITAVIASLYIIYFLTAEYLYVEFSITENEVFVKYFKTISFGSQEFKSINFPKNLYHSSTFENSYLGRLTDMTITIQTQKGLADYPTVSLSAMDLSDREKIQSELNKLKH